jgi:hypothetical protein
LHDWKVVNIKLEGALKVGKAGDWLPALLKSSNVQRVQDIVHVFISSVLSYGGYRDISFHSGFPEEFST